MANEIMTFSMLQSREVDPFTDTKHCPSCGREVPQEAEECEWCGYPFDGDVILNEDLREVANQNEHMAESARRRASANN
jgi:hypothetical protein